MAHQNSQASLASVVHHARLGARSAARVQLNSDPSMQSIMFPPLEASKNITSMANLVDHGGASDQALKRVAPQKPMDQLLSAFANMPNEEESTLDKRSTIQRST